MSCWPTSRRNAGESAMVIAASWRIRERWSTLASLRTVESLTTVEDFVRLRSLEASTPTRQWTRGEMLPLTITKARRTRYVSWALVIVCPLTYQSCRKPSTLTAGGAAVVGGSVDFDEVVSCAQTGRATTVMRTSAVRREEGMLSTQWPRDRPRGRTP